MEVVTWKAYDKTVTPVEFHEVDEVLDDQLDLYTVTDLGSDRKLRAASRKMQNWCTAYCFDRNYGCWWCKANDIYAEVNCINVVCRRRDSEVEEEPELPADFVSSNLDDFAEGQHAECNDLLAAMGSNLFVTKEAKTN